MEDSKRNILILGKKLGMTQLYYDTGTLLPVTVVQVYSGRVVGIRTIPCDGYSAVVLEFSDKNSRRGGIKELRVDDVERYKVGDEVSLDRFSKNDLVDVDDS